LFGATEVKLSSGRGRLSQWTVLFSNALEREALMRSLAAQRESLSLAFERERLLTATVRELGCPILPLAAGVLLIPLIGAIDSGRAQQFIEALLQGISRHRATTVLLDITGVPVVDTQVANTFIQATHAATLLGARVVLVGVRPEIAHSIVALGIDLRHMTTAPSLAMALASTNRGPKAFA
jgi:anti-anti-sigma regulatory factor